MDVGGRFRLHSQTIVGKFEAREVLCTPLGGIAGRTHGEGSPDIVIQHVAIEPLPAHADLLGGVGGKEYVKDTQLGASQPDMQEAGGRVLRVGHGFKDRQGIGRSQQLGRLFPAADEIPDVVHRAETRLQLGRQLVVKEAKVRGRKRLFQDGRAGKQCQRSPLRAVGRKQQDLTYSFEDGAGHVSVHRPRQADDTVAENDVQVFALEGDFAHLMNVGRGDHGIQQVAIERCRSARGRAGGWRGLGRRQCASKH